LPKRNKWNKGPQTKVKFGKKGLEMPSLKEINGNGMEAFKRKEKLGVAKPPQNLIGNKRNQGEPTFQK